MKKLAIFLVFALAMADTPQNNTDNANEESKASDEEAVYIGESVIEASAYSDEMSVILDVQSKTPTKSVSVITKDKLLESSSSSGGVLSALESVPGVTYSRQSGMGGTVAMRGMISSHDRTIIAVDGIKLEGRPVLEFHLMDQYAFDAIEVIRGAASTIYGSNAMNGVVNFKTRRYKGNINKPFTIDAKIRALEYSSVNNGIAGRTELLGGGDGWDLLIGLSGRKAENYYTPEGKVKGSSYSSWGLDWNLGYTHNNVRYYVQGRYQKVHSNEAALLNRPGSAFGLYMSLSPLWELFLRTGVEVYNPGIFADKLEAYIFFNRYNTDIELDLRNFSNVTPKGNNATYTHRFVYDSDYAGAKINFDKNIANNAISYGLDLWTVIGAKPNRVYNYDTRATTTASRDYYQIQIAPYIKDDWTILDSLIISASLRYDYLITIIGKKRYSNESAETSAILDKKGLTHQGAVTGNLGFVYYINNLFSITASGTNNFKSPGTNGLFPGNNEVQNLNLKPEYAQTGELGFRFHSDNHYVSLVGYYTNYMNMIQSTTIQTNKTQYTNIGKAFVIGAELEALHKIYDFDLGYVLAFTYGTNKTANKPLANIAPFTARVNLGYNFDWGSLKWIQRVYLGKYRVDSANERKSKTYTMSDISANIKLGYFSERFKDWELIIGIDNLFNQKGRNPSTQENPNYAYALTNPILEPGINAFVKLIHKY